MQQRLRQFVEQVHAGVQIVADAVPLDDRKLGIVQPAALAGSKGARDLEDRLSAGREQAFHVQLGRGLEETAGFETKRLDVQLRYNFLRNERRIDLNEAASVKELAELA